jgi:NDP-sugar pyrophosphorylase family protein
MDAMILAAGYGKRLRPLTDRTPKVLIEVAGATVLEHIARRLIRAGADRIIVNTHHLADQVERFAAPFLLHVGDVISELDLDALYAAQERSVNLATLAVHDRGSSRCVLFDDRGLMGRDNQVEGWERTVRAPDGPVRRWSFAGAHAVSPEIFDRFVEAPPFDILDTYLRMASEGARIAPFDVTGSRWLEVGNPKRLAQAREVLGSPTSSPPAPP